MCGPAGCSGSGRTVWRCIWASHRSRGSRWCLTPCLPASPSQFIPNGGFTESEKALLKGSYDFMGLTLYTAKYAREVPDNKDGWWVMTDDVNGKKIGEQAESVW